MTAESPLLAAQWMASLPSKFTLAGSAPALRSSLAMAYRGAARNIVHATSSGVQPLTSMELGLDPA